MSVETPGQRLRRLRQASGLSQRELAEQCERVSFAYVSRLEAGARTASVRAIRQLAAALGVPASYLEGRPPDYSDLTRTSLFGLVSEMVEHYRLGDAFSEAEIWTAVDAHAELAGDQIRHVLEGWADDVFNDLKFEEAARVERDEYDRNERAAAELANDEPSDPVQPSEKRSTS